MKFVALVSGGKDSIYSIMECQKQGHELIACVHLGRPVEESADESYMYQTAASEVIPTLVEECLQVPLVLVPRKRKSVNTSLVYQENADDEVEDLYLAIQQAKIQFPDTQAVSSGAILSTYQRVRVEHVCARLGLTSLSYLWRRAPQHELLQCMINDNITAVLVRVAAPPGLLPRRHLNKTLHELQSHFHTLHDRYQFHVCGEGGEFETLVLDCPIFKKRLVLDDIEVVEAEDGTGELLIRSCHAEERDKVAVSTFPAVKVDSSVVVTDTNSGSDDSKGRTSMVAALPHVNALTGGLYHVSEILSGNAILQSASKDEAQLALDELLDVLDTLKRILDIRGCTAQDVLMVHLYLSEISHFSLMNEHYRKFFGVVLPPSRSCVAVGHAALPGRRRVLLDCLFQRGSGQYMRTLPLRLSTIMDPAVVAAHATTTSKLREVLHVQSLSHWAPVCVGPYSQVNTLRSSIHLFAGQIGLIPASMQLCSTWEKQLAQSWRNVIQILDALDAGRAEHIVGCLLYVSDTIGMTREHCIFIEKTCSEQLQTNAGIKAGQVDGASINGQDLDGYEDEETRRELLIGTEATPSTAGKLSVLVVEIPEMPKNALVELEIIPATSSFVGSQNAMFSAVRRVLSQPTEDEDSLWPTGHTFPVPSPVPSATVELQVSTAGFCSHCIACTTVVASCTEKSGFLDLSHVCSRMLQELQVADTDLMNLRLYYHRSRVSGYCIRSAILAGIGSVLNRCPAITFVPVCGIKLLNAPTVEGSAILAIQATHLDPVHCEASRWIRHKR